MEAGQRRDAGNPGRRYLVAPDYARCSERIARAAFELAMRRRQRVTIVHKANVLKVTDGLFIEVCRKVAAEFPGRSRSTTSSSTP